MSPWDTFRIGHANSAPDDIKKQFATITTEIQSSWYGIFHSGKTNVTTIYTFSKGMSKFPNYRVHVNNVNNYNCVWL